MVEINIFRRAQNATDIYAGETLFVEGEEGDMMFAVIDGTIELTRDGRVIEEVGPGGILGELALIDNRPRGANAIAKTDARVVPVNQKDFMFLVQEHPTFAILVMSVMAERLRSANARLGTEAE